MIELSERRRVLSLVEEARAQGAHFASCAKLMGLNVRTLRRWQMNPAQADRRPTATRPVPAHALTTEEKDKIIDLCAQPEFRSLPPECIVAILADRGEYLASERSFYRVLRERKQHVHRGKARAARKQNGPTTHVAKNPNEVWVWDITWLPRHVKGIYYHLQILTDLYSRKIVAHEVWDQENGENSCLLLERAMFRETTPSGQPLVLHGDNGSALKCGTVHALCQKLGITPSHSRPRVSNDNAHAEALFRTAKYHPSLPPEGFESLEEARQWALNFVNWYNQEHRHSGIGWVTPEQKHQQKDLEILRKRREVYELARKKTPARWTRKRCRKWEAITSTTLNPVDERKLEQELKRSA